MPWLICCTCCARSQSTSRADWLSSADSCAAKPCGGRPFLALSRMLMFVYNGCETCYSIVR